MARSLSWVGGEDGSVGILECVLVNGDEGEEEGSLNGGVVEVEIDDDGDHDFAAGRGNGKVDHNTTGVNGHKAHSAPVERVRKGSTQQQKHRKNIGAVEKRAKSW